MHETIYTIPVTEVYETPCECPMCALEKRFENDRVNYYLGPSLMEPDNRIETNNTGFCGRHFAKMYNTQTNRLGLGLILDTYMTEQNKRMSKAAGSAAQSDTSKDKKSILSMLKGKEGENVKAAKAISEYWTEHEKQCCICRDLESTMDRYYDVLLYLYFSQKEFKDRFDAGMGYCMRHFTVLTEYADKHLFGSKKDEFLGVLVKQQIENLERIQGEVNWFTKKFDYRNTDAPWGNSRDSLPRGMRKMTGYREIGDEK